MNMRLSLVAMAIVAASVMTLHAEKRCGEHCKPDAAMLEKFKPLVQDLKTWAKESVMPTLREWKGQLDASMEAGDLTQLNSLRARASELRTQNKALIAKAQEAWKSNDEEKLTALRAEWKSIDEKREALLKELKPLAEKYEPSLKNIGAQAKPKVEEWVKQAKDKAENFMKENNIERGGWHHTMLAFSRDFGVGGMGHGLHHKRMMAVRFMLWDGGEVEELEQNTAPFGSSFDSAMRLNSSTPSAMLRLEQNAPNPVTADKTTINFSLPQNDRVKIVLIDVNGREVATLADAQFSAGANSVEVSTSAFANGAYIYRLTTSAGSLSKTMTITR